MRIPLYHLDAFTATPFSGNPAAVCVLAAWLPDATLQAIAAENNLSETAFVVADGAQFQLRWFTPTVEVDLCGHATLATAAVLFEREARTAIVFRTRSGELPVTRDGGWLTMDFPRIDAAKLALDALDLSSLGATPLEVHRAKNGNLMAIYGSAAEVAALKPDFAKLRLFGPIGIMTTAQGIEHDFVSRTFVPGCGIDEDPVTGSAHCTLGPYWAAHLGKPRLEARQISARGGEVRCEVLEDRVLLSGQVARYAEGAILLPDDG